MFRLSERRFRSINAFSLGNSVRAFAASFSSLVGISSGPVALCGFSPARSLYTPLTVIVMSGYMPAVFVLQVV